MSAIARPKYKRTFIAHHFCPSRASRRHLLVCGRSSGSFHRALRRNPTPPDPRTPCPSAASSAHGRVPESGSFSPSAVRDAQSRNPHTRRAYARAVGEFLAWSESVGVASLPDVQPLQVASWIEIEGREVSAPSVKQRLAALRHLFDWLVIGQVMSANPAASVRGPRHVVRSGKTSVLEPVEARRLLDSIDATTPAGLRDRALVSLMVY